MLILVDHDNIDDSIRRRGGVFLVDHILGKLEAAFSPPAGPVLVRFYGGWFNGRHPTQRSQQLSAELLGSFPRVMTFPRTPTDASYLVNAELALSTLSLPTEHLFWTFRSRPLTSNITARTPGAAGCTATDCPIAPISQFLLAKRCSVPSCRITPADLLTKSEQKLVDTMIAVDLVSSVAATETLAVLVSSDDDLWPSIQARLVRGFQLIRLQPKPMSMASYTVPPGAKFSSIPL